MKQKQIKINDYEYTVLDCGVVLDSDSGLPLHAVMNSEGHFEVVLSCGEVRKVCDLVAEAFIKSFIEGPKRLVHVNHCKADNSRGNLKYIGEMDAHEKDYKGIKQYTISGKYLKVYSSASEAARMTGISRVNITTAVNGTNPRGIAGKYIWV